MKNFSLRNNIFLKAVMVALIFISYRASGQIPELMYFKFNSATGGAVPNDAQAATRVSTTGTLLAPTTIGGAGQFGTALEGNGAATYATNALNANWPLNLNGQWTISLWIKGVNNAIGAYYAFGTTAGTSFRAFTGTSLIAGGGNLMIRGTGLTDVTIPNVFDATGSAVVVHIVYDNTQIRTYINGVPSIAVPQAGSVVLTGPDFIVSGQTTAYGGLPIGGLMDEFRMYNRALSATEIQNTWNIDLSTPIGCTVPGGLNVSGITTTDATFNWNAVPSSLGYEYIVNQTSTSPTTAGTATTNTSYTATGLTPNTTYYIHIRNKCSASSFSDWVTVMFKTKAPCSEPTPLMAKNITHNSADIQWTSQVAAVTYEYSIDTARSMPVGGYTVTGSTTVSASNLLSDRWYYIYIRSNCGPGMNSVWHLDSFKTKRTCPSPNVDITNINTKEAVIYWQPVPDAITYEYVINNASDVPKEGTKIALTSLHASALKDGVDYYYHIRCNCKQDDYTSNSDWTTTSFKTFPTSVNSTQQNTFKVDAYPNPAHDRVAIKVNGSTPTNGILTMQDVSGKILQVIPVIGNTTYIDLTHVATGVYMIKYTDDAHTEIMKINKQ
jgi:hypothetical protein